MASLAEQIGALATKGEEEPSLKGAAIEAVPHLTPTGLEPGIFLRMMAAGRSSEMAGSLIRQSVEDAMNAKAGDVHAKNRLEARAMINGMIAGGLVPGAAEIGWSAKFLSSGAGALASAASAATTGGNIGSAAVIGGIFGLGSQALIEDLGPWFMRTPPGEVLKRSLATPVGRITAALQALPPLLTKRATIVSAQRIARMKAAQEAAFLAKEAGATPEQMFHVELSKLTGQMEKVHTQVLREVVKDADVQDLFHQIDIFPLGWYERIHGKTGLDKLLRGDLPIPSEVETLNKVFGEEFLNATREKSGFLRRIGGILPVAGNLSRALQSSYDLSMTLQQGFWMLSRPRALAQGAYRGAKAWTSQEIYDGMTAALHQWPRLQMALDAGLSLTATTGAKMTREEQYIAADLASKLPLIGRGVKASARAAVATMNGYRVHLFDEILDNAARRKGANIDLIAAQSAKFINAFTGRGSFTRALNMGEAAQATERAIGPFLSGLFYSPKLAAGRLEATTSLLNPTYWKMEPEVRKAWLKTVFGTTGVVMSIAAGLSAAGWIVGKDRRSADFLKARNGDVRIDLTGGNAQLLRLTSQIYMGERVNSATGEVQKLGEGNNPTRMDLVNRYIEQKEAPLPSLFTEYARQTKKYPFSPAKALASRVTPFGFQDAQSIMDAVGREKGLGLLALQALGVGVLSYPTNIHTSLADQIGALATAPATRPAPPRAGTTATPSPSAAGKER